MDEDALFDFLFGSEWQEPAAADNEDDSQPGPGPRPPIGRRSASLRRPFADAIDPDLGLDLQ